jgi:hypothetical protein
MKKILLFLGMFLFIFNVKALTFNVDVTNIEEEGTGTLGTITSIDAPNKSLDVLFEDIGAEVNFSITVTNSGDRAGTLRSIDFENENPNIEYTSNLPEGGLAINGNDTNKVIINAKVKEGATNGSTTSQVKIKYTYDEGSCPEGEILSEDESMCLCPEGMERNENGICVKPEKPVECADDEIYNETKKICEKKVIPVDPDKPTPKPIPSNPKTLDNIILITLLFFVSGLGIYAVLFRKLKTKKQKVTAGVITGVATLSLSFTVLAGVFGLDNLLSAIVNPITKSKELVVTVNEEIDLIETWDGDCDARGVLTPDKVFEGGSGTESDPYQIKTANQLACFAKSVNNGTTYEGQYIKQIKNIKLNDNLNDQATNGDLSNAHVWISAGYYYYDQSTSQNVYKTFAGTYDGDNHIISGLYITNDSSPAGYKGLFGHSTNATFKNITLSDVYANTSTYNFGALSGYTYKNLTVENVTTYGNAYAGYSAGLIAYHNSSSEGSVRFENVTNNINLSYDGNYVSGIIHKIEGVPASDEPNIIFRNVTNNGDRNVIGYSQGTGGIVGTCGGGYLLMENAANNGDFNFDTGTQNAGLVGELYSKAYIKDSYNTGNSSNMPGTNPRESEGGYIGGLVGRASNETVIENCYNSGNIIAKKTYNNGITIEEAALANPRCYVAGIVAGTSSPLKITNSYNTGDISGLYGYASGIVGSAGGSYNDGTFVENCYNTGDITGLRYTGGLVAYFMGNVNKSYNTGKVTVFGGTAAGGLVGYQAGDVTNSYNTGELFVPALYGNLIGGFCSQCRSIKNSYNRGNVISTYTAQIAGFATNTNIIENSYNSGNIIFEGGTGGSDTVMLGGISYNGGYGSDASLKNLYNLGNLEINFENFNPGTVNIAGLNLGFSGAPTVNSVNKGNITVTRSSAINSGINVGGISVSGAKDCFNAGTINVPESTSQRKVGQILNEYNTSSTGNKFNTDPNGFAIGCIGLPGWDSCTPEASLGVGTYTTEEAPDILSIINGDNAFNDELDEDGLPTLKVFNN